MPYTVDLDSCVPLDGVILRITDRQCLPLGCLRKPLAWVYSVPMRS